MHAQHIAHLLATRNGVYIYPREHCDYWREVLPDIDFGGAAFGENPSVEGLLEGDLRIGDRLTIGSTEFEVRQPRFSCFTLAIRLGRAVTVARALHETGWRLASPADRRDGVLRFTRS